MLLTIVLESNMSIHVPVMNVVGWAPVMASLMLTIVIEPIIHVSGWVPGMASLALLIIVQ